MSETRGVFSIRGLYGLKIEDKWINPEDTWISPSPFYGESLNNGYFGGTNNPSFKMDFSDDSVSNTPSIPNNVYQVDYWSVGNQLFGYLAGNPSQTPTSATKITYSTSSSELIPTIPSLSTPGSGAAAAVGNETNGYVGTNSQQSLINKITYSTDNVEALPSTTSNYYGDQWQRYATVGNTAAGYFIGGSANPAPDPNYQTQIEKITYSTENFSNVTSTGIIRKTEQTVASGNATAGYISGMEDNPATLMQKLTYSSESAAYIPGSGPPYVSFPGDRSRDICSSGNSTHGYFLGGNGNTTEYGKIDYTTDTLASNTFLPSDYNREQLQGLGPRDNALPFSNVLFPAPSGPDVNLFNQSETPNIGYFGGNDNVQKNKYNFADETVLLAPGAQHPNTRAKSGGNTTHAYHFGDGPAVTYTTYKTEYATDTTGASSVATAPTNYERRDHKVIGNQTDAYLFGSSNYNLGKTYYDKFTYSTDTFATSPFPKAVPIPANNNYQSHAAAIGNQTHGYLTGGGPSNSSEIWRMVYSTDTIDSTPSANTQVPASDRRFCAGVGNGSAGYFCGGSSSSSFEKFVYSNDTISSVPGLPLLSTDTAPAAGGATGNSTHGYINTQYYRTDMSKITYSTDTSSVAENLINVGPENWNTGVGPRQFDLPFRGPLPPTPTPQNALGSFPISNNGYFMGSPGSNPNKISFTDDSVSSVTTLSSHSTNSAGELQNSAHGYDIRKTNSQPDSKKIHFNIETDFLIPSITDSDVREGAKGSGNSTDGYLLGQQGLDGSNNVDKLQYSTDTLSPLPVAPTVMGRHAAAGNSTHGYFAGGVSGGASIESHIQRIIYSTDTTEFVPSVNLSEARKDLAAAGNDTHGYFVGGDPANKTNVDRITYATNTGDVSSINMYPNTSLTPGQHGSIATGNSTYGYFNMSSSRLNKLEYTTSTSTPFPSLMTFAGYNFFPSPGFRSAFSAKENGFPQTGNTNQLGPVNL